MLQLLEKNRKNFMKKGGGVQKYPRGYLGGVIEMSTFVYEGGRGGQKSPKNRPHGLCMTPDLSGLPIRGLFFGGKLS